MLLNGRDRSPFTRRVAVALAIVGLDVERVRFTSWDNLARAREFNPLGRIPSLVLDNGDVIFDSAAILDYVCERIGESCVLLPPRGVRRRQVIKYSCCAMGIVEKAVHSRYERVMRPREMIQQSWLDHNKTQARTALAWLESEVQENWVFDFSPVNQAVIDTVVMLDYLAIGDPEIYVSRKYPALEAIRAKARGIEAFSDTDLEKERRELGVSE